MFFLPKIKCVCVFLIIGTLLFVSSCSADKNGIKNIEMINAINERYYNLSAQGIRNIEFKYDSEKFRNLPEQIKNKQLSSLISQIEFVVRWSGGTDVVISTNNIPRLKNANARIGMDRIISGTKKEIKGLFLIITPVLDDLIKYRGNVEYLIVDDESGVIITLNHRLKKLTEKMYFDKALKLIKTETYKNNKLVATNSTMFIMQDGKYILQEIQTTISGKSDIKTVAKIQYTKKDDLFLPTSIMLDSTIGDNETANEVNLIPLKVNSK